MTDVLHAPTVTVPPASVDGATRTGWRESKWLALPVLLAGTFLVVLDFFIVNVALPSMQRELARRADARSNGSSPATA